MNDTIDGRLVDSFMAREWSTLLIIHDCSYMTGHQNLYRIINIIDRLSGSVQKGKWATEGST